jgi:hypothetical protein
MNSSHSFWSSPISQDGRVVSRAVRSRKRTIAGGSYTGPFGSVCSLGPSSETPALISHHLRLGRASLMAKPSQLKEHGAARRRLNDALESKELACAQAEIIPQRWNQHLSESWSQRQRGLVHTL